MGWGYLVYNPPARYKFPPTPLASKRLTASPETKEGRGLFY